ncbi:DMT family transporter [Legionella pneumophila]|uniref:DMT family transporter n=1 Tax=Legionella pneumophila TaxID=446 RepID=UPI00077810BD|nr:DMT family transporter [Legionella pneumophila]HAT8666484.1 EamA family transporter [Legionella pneumophila]
MEKKSEVGVYLQLTMVQLIWGGAFIIGQLALTKQPVMTTLLIRNLGVSLGFILILCCSKKYRWQMLPRATIWPLFGMGLFGVVLYNILAYWGLSLSSAISASLLIPTLQPLTTVLITHIKEINQLSRSQHLGLLAGFLGAIATLTGDWSLHPGLHNMLGNLLLLLAAFSFSLYSTLSKSVLNHLPSLYTTAYATIIGSLLFLPISFFGDHRLILEHLSIEFGLYMGYLIILGGVLSFLWWSHGVKYLGPSQTGVITLLMPPFALMLAAVVLQQSISLLQMIGIVLSLSGVGLSTGLVKVSIPFFVTINKKG